MMTLQWSCGCAYMSHYENVPFEVPDGWSWVKMEDYVFGVTDGDHQPPPQAKKGVPFLVISDVNTGNIKFEKSRFVEESYFCSLPDNRKASKGDLLFTVTGSYGIVIPVETERDFCFQRHIGLIKVIVDSSWLKYVLMSKYVQSYCDEVATGTAQKTVGLATLRDLLIPIPPLSEQQRIISVIEQYMSSVDDVKTSTSILKDCIEKVKSKILDLAIHGKLVSQDTNDEPASELLKRINPKAVASCDNPHYGRLPEKWSWIKLGQLFNIVSAKRVTKDQWKSHGVPFYRTREIVQLSQNGYVDNVLYIDIEHYESLRNKYGIPKSGDIMLTAVGTIGKTYVVSQDDKFYYKDASVLCMRNEHNMNSQYISLAFSSALVQKQLYEKSKGTTVDTITIEKANNYIVPIPPIEEQSRIVAKVNELFSQLDMIEKSLQA